MSVRVNKGKPLGPTTAGVRPSSHEVTMPLNPTDNVDQLDSSFTHNIFEKTVSSLFNNFLPTDPRGEVQGRVHITLSSKFTGCITEGGQRM